MEVSSYGGSADRVVGPGADPQGPVGEHRGRGRPHRRGHHRHRADPQLPASATCAARTRPRSASARCSTSPPVGWSRSRSTTSGSRSPTSSSSATASTTASSTATCGSSASSGRRSTAPEAGTRVTMHRRPLGRGRTLAARRRRPRSSSAASCRGGRSAATPGIPAAGGQRLRGQRDHRLPRRRRDARARRAPVRGRRPADGLDRWLSFATARGRRLARLRLAGHRAAAQRRVPVHRAGRRSSRTARALWIAGLGLASCRGPSTG